MTVIVDYVDARHAAAFRAVNLAWIERHFRAEAKDVEILNAPQDKIVDQGGVILMAEDPQGAVLGGVALIRMDDGGFELSKMGVDERARGGGVGRALVMAAIERARALGAHRLYLETNSALKPALALYDSVGFRPIGTVGAVPSCYERCDTRLELLLDA